MLRIYLKTAWRNAVANKVFTLINLGSLVIGITLFIFISIWLTGELSYDKGFANADRIYRVETNLQMQDGSLNSLAGVGWPVGKVLATEYPEIERVTYLRNWRPIINVNGTHFYEDGLYADNEFLKVFSYQLLEGTTSNALKEPFSIVISEEMKQKYFANQQNVIGKILMLNDTVPYKVTGIFKKPATPSHLKFEMLASLSTMDALSPKMTKDEYASGWFDVNMYNFIQLKKNASADALGAKVKNLVEQHAPEVIKQTGFKPSLTLRPLTKIYLYSNMPTVRGSVGNIQTVRLFFLIGLFILAIACLNFINLTTSKSVERAKEIGVKKVLGCDRKKLIVQFLMEAGLLCISAVAISIVLLALLIPEFNQLSGKTYTWASFFSYTNCLLIVAIIVVLIPLAGFYPALVLSSFKPIAVLKGKVTSSLSGVLLRKGLVISQFVISISFIIGTIIIWKQMNFMQNQNLGFDKDKILLVNQKNLPGNIVFSNNNYFKNTLMGKPGIVAISANGGVPGRSGWTSQFAWPEGKPKDAQLIVEYIPVDEAYLHTLGLRLKAGRDFRPGSKLDSAASLIVNEAAVREFGWKNAEDALGKKLTTSGKDGQVIGVLKDYHQHGLQEKINPVVLGVSDYPQLLAIRYGNISPQKLTAEVKTAWSAAYKGYELDYRFMDEDFQLQYQDEAKFEGLFTIAAFFSIVIACMGLLGLAIFTAQKRIKEIGVRKVLGASVSSIAVLLSKDFLKLVVVAIAIAMPLSWWAMGQWLQKFAYRITISYSIFLAAGAVAILLSILTISYQAIKAAIADPVKGLRSE